MGERPQAADPEVREGGIRADDSSASNKEDSPFAFQPSGYGHEIVAGVSRVRVLISLTTRNVDGLMDVKALEAQSPLVDEVWNLGDEIFQDDDAPIRAVGLVQSWFNGHENEVKHLPQSTDLNIIELFWSVLERSMRNQYPPPASLPELSQYLHEEWYNISLNTIQYLYESIPMRIQLY
ncbi:DDE_3 domain-containing protein [Trichonephila clavipes]|nr:DDE_3 domain-containing protein [Trichonephila clavipes]